MTVAQKVALYNTLLRRRTAVRVLMISSPTMADWFAWEEMAATLDAEIAALELPAHLTTEQRAGEEGL